ncbi:MAG: twin-arginine translocation pathway signal protein, partial [Rubellimicrobium sp.]|nr:twin-arginine translocation pathway signal protein [Rubellimicrobium sp.]
MTLSRRKTLGIIGGGTIFAATGAAGFAVTRQPNTAHVPWDRAGDYADDRMRALSHAILAPNPHNRQPWLVDLSTPDQVTLHADPDRLLPHTDPFSRQIVIGLGCFLEVMRMAAAEEGRGVTFDLFPEGSDELDLDARPVDLAPFGGAATPAPHFAQLPH